MGPGPGAGGGTGRPAACLCHPRIARGGSVPGADQRAGQAAGGSAAHARQTGHAVRAPGSRRGAPAARAAALPSAAGRLAKISPVAGALPAKSVTCRACPPGLIKDAEMTQILDALVNLLTLERIEENLFRGASQDLGFPQLFGGQVLGQVISAASQTVTPERHVHSLHGYFLL